MNLKLFETGNTTSVVAPNGNAIWLGVVRKEGGKFWPTLTMYEMIRMPACESRKEAINALLMRGGFKELD